MYSLNKIVGWCVSPVGIALLGFVAAGALFSLQKRKGAEWRKGLLRRAGRWLLWISVGWTWLWATPMMVRIVGAPLESEFLVDGHIPSIESYPQADAIVLLGGSMMGSTNVTLYGEMSMSADRVWQAARLWQAGKAPKIIATGTGCKASTGRLLSDFGVPRDAIVFADAPRNTEEEAKAIRKRLVGAVEVGAVEVGGLSGSGSGTMDVMGSNSSVPHKSPTPTRVLLVTSAWHMKRAKMMFARYATGLDTVPAPADFENTVASSEGFKLLDLFPSPIHLTFNSIAFREWLGIVGYKWFR